MNNKVFAAGLAFLTLAGAASAEGIHKDVHFAPGTYGSSFSGTIHGYDYDTYVFYARKGQQLSAGLSSDNLYPALFNQHLSDSVDLSQYSPNLDENGKYVLPYSGRYELRVMQTRNDARSGGDVPYTLNLQIR